MGDLLEKVIKGIECCRRGFCFSCPYNDGVDENTECKQKWADDAISLLKTQEPQWTSVKDHYPTATTEYQVALSTGGVIGAWWFNGEKDFIVGDTVITNNVTHWAPLLKHPSETQREDEAASDMRDYCERYEPTYNPEDGSM